MHYYYIHITRIVITCRKSEKAQTCTFLCFTPVCTLAHTATDSPTPVDIQLDRCCGGGWGTWFKCLGAAQGVA